MLFRVFSFLLITCTLFSLSGCGKAKPPLSDIEVTAMIKGAEREFSSGKTRKALKYLKRIAKRNPNCEMCWFRAATLITDSAKYNRALGFLKKGFKYFPESAILTYVQAQVHYRTGKYEKAAGDFRRVAAILKDNLKNSKGDELTANMEQFLRIYHPLVLESSINKLLMGRIEKAHEQIEKCSYSSSVYQSVFRVYEEKVYAQDSNDYRPTELRKDARRMQLVCSMMGSLYECIEGGAVKVPTAQDAFRSAYSKSGKHIDTGIKKLIKESKVSNRCLAKKVKAHKRQFELDSR